MNNFLNKFKFPAVISLIIVFPFMVLEFINRRSYHEGFPIMLFVILWLLGLTFIFILIPLAQNIRKRVRFIANPAGFLLRILFLALIAWVWIGTIFDQMPCFLGVPNCD